jgi:hypothetical protein
MLMTCCSWLKKPIDIIHRPPEKIKSDTDTNGRRRGGEFGIPRSADDKAGQGRATAGCAKCEARLLLLLTLAIAWRLGGQIFNFNRTFGSKSGITSSVVFFCSNERVTPNREPQAPRKFFMIEQDSRMKNQFTRGIQQAHRRSLHRHD